MELFRSFSTDVAAADDRRDGRQEPGHRARARPISRRRPRGSCAAPSGSAGRSARRTRGSTSSGRSTTSSSACSSRRPRRSRSATRSSARTGSARSSTRRRSIGTRPRSPRRAATGRVFIGGEHLTDGDLARGFYVEPTVVGGLPASHRLFRDELFAPFTAVHAVDSFDEALHLANDTVYGLTAGVYSEDPAEVQRFLDTHPGGRPVRQPAGRRDDRRVAGRPGVRRLEGQRLDRQGRPLDVLRRPVPARAEPHRRRLGRRTWQTARGLTRGHAVTRARLAASSAESAAAEQAPARPTSSTRARDPGRNSPARLSIRRPRSEA